MSAYRDKMINLLLRHYDPAANDAIDRVQAAGGYVNPSVVNAVIKVYRPWLSAFRALYLPGEACVIDQFGQISTIFNLLGIGADDLLQPAGNLQQPRVIDSLLGPVLAIQMGGGYYDATLARVTATYLYVGRNTPAGVAALLYDGESVVNRQPIAATSTGYWQIATGGVSPTTVTSPVAATGTQAGIFRFGASIGEIRIGNTITTGAMASSSSNTLRFGARYTATGNWSGRVAELAVLNDIGDLSAASAEGIQQATYRIFPSTKP